MKPADLKPGQRIATDGMGVLTVVADPYDDCEFATAHGESEWGRVYVDIECDEQSRKTSWDCDDLPAATGAEAFTWLTMSPLRYRLTYKPDTNVKVENL